MRVSASSLMAKLPVIMLVLALNTMPARADDLANKGQKLAEANCSRCHVVDDSNKFGGIASTPSFRVLVRGLTDWRTRFETFHVRLPHQSVIRIKGTDPVTEDPPTTQQVFIELDDIDALVAYAETFIKKK